MQIVAALFVENIEFRPVPGPSTRIDITGAFFSTAPEQFPVEMTPHLVVLLRTTPEGPTSGTLVAEFHRGDELLARNVQPVSIEPGKFGYRLVRPELHITEPGVIEVTCTLTETQSTVRVPLTILPALS
jgi:hypothetical protein